MQLNLDAQTAGDHIRSVGEHAIILASGTRDHSFVIAAGVDTFVWSVNDVTALTPADCEPLFALQPAVMILGTGTNQRFPSREVLAAFLTRRIGIEVMNNAAAARTYNVLLGEGRKVAAGFILPKTEATASG